jgi:predicted nucleic acid-binding protein
MKYYADTGFLLSLHLQETTSARAAAAVLPITEPLPVTPLVALEFRNALRLAAFRKQLVEAERAAAWASFEKDISGGVLDITQVDSAAVYAESESLCDQFTSATGVRTLDLLHVASARVLGRSEFLSFDMRQRSLAALAGLNVLPNY